MGYRNRPNPYAAGGPPSGPASGALAGTYPGPSLADGAVTSAAINNALKDAAANTASLRTLGTGALQASPGNHTHNLNALNGILPFEKIPVGTTGDTVSVGNHTHNLTALNGVLPLAQGGTGSSTPAAARAVLGAVADDDPRLSDARPPTPHAHAAGDITSGVLAFARIPVGTTGTTVSVGNHTHNLTALNGVLPVAQGGTGASTPAAARAGIDAAASSHAHTGEAIVSGTVPFARLPVGTTGDTVSVGNHTHNLSALNAPTQDLSMVGHKIVSLGSPAAASDAATKGYVDGLRQASGLVAGTAGRLHRMVAACIRNTGAGFELINDAAHAPIGVLQEVVTTSTYIRIDFSFVASKVNAVVAIPDERFAMAGYVFGTSVGTSSVTIQVGQPGGFGDYVYYDGSVWRSLNGLVSSFSWDSASGFLTCTHAATDPVSGSFTSRSLANRGVLDQMSVTTSRVAWVNASGVTVKTPTTDLRGWLTRTGTRVVDPTTLTIASSNIWILGTLEL